jgi:hypothetical protein
VPGKKDDLFGKMGDAFDKMGEAFDVMDEAFEVHAKEVDTHSQESFSNGVSRQSVSGRGYDVQVTKHDGRPALIIVSTDPDVKIVVNGKDVGFE